jgi:hypothetical protein
MTSYSSYSVGTADLVGRCVDITSASSVGVSSMSRGTLAQTFPTRRAPEFSTHRRS